MTSRWPFRKSKAANSSIQRSFQYGPRRMNVQILQIVRSAVPYVDTHIIDYCGYCGFTLDHAQ